MREFVFEVELTEPVVAALGCDRSEIPATLREAAILGLIRNDKLTESQARDALGLERHSLLALLERHGITAIRISPESLP